MDALTSTDLILIFLVSKPLFILGTFIILATQFKPGANAALPQQPPPQALLPPAQRHD